MERVLQIERDALHQDSVSKLHQSMKGSKYIELGGEMGENAKKIENAVNQWVEKMEFEMNVS